MTARSSEWLTVLVVLASCGTAHLREPTTQGSERVITAAAVEPAPTIEPTPAPALPPACTEWDETVEVAHLTDARLDEVSGLVASRAHEGVLYVHNDSGEPYARFFAITLEGAVLAEIVIDGAPARDFEDLAYHDGWLYLADTGDNGARDGSQPVHEDVALVRVREPELPAEAGGTVHVSDFERFVLRYADRPRDCEAVFVDPITSDFYFLSKENEGPVDVFVAHAPLSRTEPNTLEHAGTMPGAGSLANAITAADITSDGAGIVVRTYLRAFLYPRASGEDVARALGRAPVELPVIREWQGEAIGFSVDGRTLYSIPEGDDAPVHTLSARCASPG
jgi:hypothetical protein